MFIKNKTILFILILILNFYSALIISNDIKKIQIIKDNYNIDTLELIDYKENISLLKEKEAKYYILNFWASWCAPCIREMKSLNLLQKKNSNIRVITISEDNNVSESQVFFKKNNYKYLEKYFDKEKKIFSLFPIRGLPTTFIANEEFKVFAKVEGIIEWNSQVFKKWLFSN